MKKTLRLVGVAAMVLLLAASCKKEEKNNGEKQMMTFSAGIEQGNSKTSLTPDGPHAYKQLWTEGDQISVNGSQITLDAGCGGKEVGTFSGEAVKADHYYAVYPESAWRDGNKAVFTIPEIQNYNKDNGYPLNVNGPMYASSDDQTLQFHNLCGLMQLNLKSGIGRSLTVTKLEVVSYLVNQVGLYGTSEPVDLTSGNPTLTIANTNNKSVTLNCGEGVEIGTEQATPFVIALPPYTFGYNATIGEGGLFVNVYVDGTDGVYASIQYKKEIIVKAGEVAYTEATICPQMLLITKAFNDQDVTATTAIGRGSVMSLEQGLNVVEKGIVYQASNVGEVLDPTVATYVPASTTKDEDFSAELTGLESGQSYYCWAYAKCKYRDAVDYDFIQYGGLISFTTKNSSVPVGFVDLGTHVGGVPTGKPLYWAKCNVGATNPQDYGNYYSWGFTSPQTGSGIYWGANGYYFGYEGAQGFKIHTYCHNSSYWEYKAGVSFGTTMDNESVLRYSDDVAYTTSNGLNRMPTKEEYDELKQKAYFVWTTNYNSTGKAGCIVYKSFDSSKDHGFTKTSTHTYSTSSDMHIFIPAGGNKDYTSSSALNVGTLAKIWTKSLYTVLGDYDPRYAMAIGLKSNQFINGDSYGNYYQGRCVSLNIRPVREGN